MLSMISNSLSGQIELSDSAEISVITCRPGDDVYNIFGHTAIKISDPLFGKNEFYNYGIFDFRTPNFTMKFLRGKLLYQLGIGSSRAFMEEYNYSKRSVFEQVLDLNTQEKNNLYNALRLNYRPENRAYLYDFFFDNCSTRPRDLLIENIEGLSFPPEDIEKISYRNLLDQFTYSRPWLDFGIDLIIGSIADKNAGMLNQMFLPEYLYKHLAKATKENKPLVKSAAIVIDYENQLEKRSKITLFTPMLLFLILLLLELILFQKFYRATSPNHVSLYDKIWFLILGIGSLVLSFMWWGTDHIATKLNLNLLWMHPLFLVLVFKVQRSFFIITAILMLLALVISPFIQEIHVASIIIIIISILKILRCIGNKSS